MANITKEMENIRDAQLGEEVRGSIISGLEKINLETENTTELVETKIVELDASETTRQSNESTRQTNEATRQVGFAQSIEDVNAIIADVEQRLANGEFIGATPSHEWNGTNIRFKQGDGTWGPWTNLQGPKGDPGSLENATADRVATTDGTNVQQNLDGLRTELEDVVHMGYDSEGKPFTIKYYSKNDIASYIYQNRLVVNKGFIKHYGEYADFSMTITLKVTTSTELTMFDFPFYEFGKISSSVAGAVINNSRLNDDGGGSGVKKIGGYNISTQGENNSLYIQGFVSGDVVTFSGRLYFKV